MLGRNMLGSLIVMGLSTAAMAQDTPYEPQYGTGGFMTRSARIVMPAQLHPEVAVSRSLAAQPVHPHMVKVVIGDVGASGVGATTHTWIDPLQRLDGENRLDEGHSLVRAQRLYLSLSGTTTEQINELRHHSHQLQQHYAGQSRARIVVAPRQIHVVDDEQVARPLVIMPAPNVAPKPMTPKGEDDKLIAVKD